MRAFHAQNLTQLLAMNHHENQSSHPTIDANRSSVVGRQPTIYNIQGNMTDDEKRIAIAEACGWRRNPVYDIPNPQSATTIPGPKLGYEAWVNPEGRMVWSLELPSFLSDLNAMHEAEKHLNEEYNGLGSRTYFRNVLCQICGSHAKAVHATARQRADAFLKTIGKLVEKLLPNATI